MKTITFTFLICSFSTMLLTAQNSEFGDTLKKETLKDLILATESDLLGKDIQLDGESIPIYNVKGERIKGMELITEFQSGKYSVDFYLNQNKEVKVVMLSLPSEGEEKATLMTKKHRKSLAIGDDAYHFSVTDIKGTKYSLDALKGKIVVLNFWFVECKPCIMEMPELNKLVEKYKGENVVFLGFSTNSLSKIDSFLEKKKFNYNIIADSQNIADDYNVTGYPTHIVIDQSAKVSFTTTGLGQKTISHIKAAIERLKK